MFKSKAESHINNFRNSTLILDMDFGSCVISIMPHLC